MTLTEVKEKLINMIQGVSEKDPSIEFLYEFVQQWSLLGNEYLQKLQNTLLYQKSLLEILKKMNQEKNLSILLPFILDKAIELTNAERGYLLWQEQTIARNFSGDDLYQELGFSQSVVHKVRETKKPIITDNARFDPNFSQSVSIQEFKLLSILCVPLVFENNVIGIIYLDNRLVRGNFTLNHQDLLCTFAEQACIAIENANLHEKLQQRTNELSQYNELLEHTVEQKTQELHIAQTQLNSSSKPYHYYNIYSKSAKMKNIFTLIDKMKSSNLSVLIQGESGTGKELIAQAIHNSSIRSNKPFLSENCAAIAESLFESELFGYKKGAFTGATQNHAGLFEQANGGTLFLDEIGELSLEMQKKLLRVLAEKKIRCVGGNEYINIDVRIISATNKNLAKMVTEGKFREDLYYRLKEVEIDLPPLRERKEDIPLLVDHFVQELDSHKIISTNLLECLLDYSWPGNIRQLKNEIHRIVTLSDTVLEQTHLSQEILQTNTENTIHPLQEYLAQIEKTEILKALEITKQNKVQAAKLLGISRFTLLRKLEKWEELS